MGYQRVSRSGLFDGLLITHIDIDDNADEFYINEPVWVECQLNHEGYPRYRLSREQKHTTEFWLPREEFHRFAAKQLPCVPATVVEIEPFDYREPYRNRLKAAVVVNEFENTEFDNAQKN